MRARGIDDVSAIIKRAAARLERRRLAGGPDVEGWVPLAQVPALGMPIDEKRRRRRTKRLPPRNPEPLPANHPIAARILASLITPWR